MCMGHALSAASSAFGICASWCVHVAVCAPRVRSLGSLSLSLGSFLFSSVCVSLPTPAAFDRCSVSSCVCAFQVFACFERVCVCENVTARASKSERVSVCLAVAMIVINLALSTTRGPSSSSPPLSGPLRVCNGRVSFFVENKFFDRASRPPDIWTEFLSTLGSIYVADIITHSV